MDNTDLARKFMQKADQDALALRRFSEDPEIPSEILGFHAQQSVEKRLKAILAHHGIHFRKTHDILELIDLLNDNNHPFPKELEDIQKLTRYAVELRYETLLPEQPPLLTRELMLEYEEQVKSWCEQQLSS